jgi:hypothetical protein
MRALPSALLTHALQSALDSVLNGAFASAVVAARKVRACAARDQRIVISSAGTMAARSAPLRDSAIVGSHA